MAVLGLYPRLVMVAVAVAGLAVLGQTERVQRVVMAALLLHQVFQGHRLVILVAVVGGHILEERQVLGGEHQLLLTKAAVVMEGYLLVG